MEEAHTMILLLHWLLNAIALLIVAHFVPGFEMKNLLYALLAVVVIGLLNATIGLFLKIITFPLSILTLGVFLLVINAIILLFASKILPGFEIHGFIPAFVGALALALISMFFHFIGRKMRTRSS
jgi:putative membrane protein